MITSTTRLLHARNKKGATIARNSLIYMVRPLGLEPRAHGLKELCTMACIVSYQGLTAILGKFGGCWRLVAATRGFSLLHVCYTRGLVVDTLEPRTPLMVKRISGVKSRLFSLGGLLNPFHKKGTPSTFPHTGQSERGKALGFGVVA